MISFYNRHIYEKRILNEVSDIFLNYNNVKLEYSDNRKIIITSKIKNYCIEIELEYSYPFIPPTVKIDNISSFEFYKLPTMRMYNIMSDEKISNIICFCCSSFLNKRNWSPCRKMTKIIDEIIYIINLKKKIYFSILIDKIKNKYLINDINLFQYLFSS
jgi:hypothetical protein